ncbi:MAG: hypothetical protein ACJARZ_002346 [Dokdonia sp.]|jgi:hypothetical protein
MLFFGYFIIKINEMSVKSGIFEVLLGLAK